jgi:hypothetical protein
LRGSAPHHSSAGDARTTVQIAAPHQVQIAAPRQVHIAAPRQVQVAIAAQSFREFGSQFRSVLIIENLCS